MKNPWEATAQEVVEAFASDVTNGLTQSEAALRLETHHLNKFEIDQKVQIIFMEPMIFIGSNLLALH